MTIWTGIVIASDIMMIDGTIAKGGAAIIINTDGRNTGITMNTGPMDIIIPAMIITGFPAHGYSRGDFFPYPLVEIEIDFTGELVHTTKKRASR